MSNQIHPANQSGHGDFERSDIGVRGVVYFLVGLVVFLLVSYFVADGLYHFLDKRTEREQAPVSPLVTNAPTDTRHEPEKVGDAFPEPRLEEDERGQLNDIRLKEEETLSSYGYIDKNAGTVRIPIDRAMDLIAQRGLPVREQGVAHTAAPMVAATVSPAPKAEKKKSGKKK